MPLAPRDAGLRKVPKLSSHLDFLFRIDILGRAAGRPVTAATVPTLPANLRALITAGAMRLNAAGEVQVFVRTSEDPAVLVPALQALGFVTERVAADQRIVQGWAPVFAIEAISKLDGVTFVDLPRYPQRSAGSVTTQGDAILNADDVRAALGADGSGVRVGVISDGLEGLAAAQATGDLPAVNSTTCNVVPQSPTAPGAGAEGTAMLEIVHDIAPGAELWFGHFGTGTVLDFMAAVDCLADHVDVIVDDIGWFNVGPYDGTSMVSLNAAQELNDPANRVRAYVNAVGNEADSHYQEGFVDSGFIVGDPLANYWSLHRFQATSATSDAGLGLPCALGIFCGDTVRLSPGAILIVHLQWSEPFGNASSDYDLLLLDESDGSLSVMSADSQVGFGSDPVEVFAWVNSHGVETYVDILIGNYLGWAPARTFDMFLACYGCVPIAGNVHNFNTASSSVPNNSDAGGGVMSLGAINASDPGNDTIADYSSRGPTNDGRLKPDAVAIDGVAVTGAGGFPVPFYGTSAAAPHGGAIAALLLSCNPVLRAGEPGDDPAADRAALRNALLGSATDLGTPGSDNTYGAGRLDALAAASAIGPCAAPRAVLCGAFDDCDHDDAFPPVYGDGCTGPDETTKSLNGVAFDNANPWDFYTVPVPALKSAPDPGGVFRDNRILPADAQAVFGYASDPAANGVGKPWYEADLNGNGVKDGWEYDRSLVGAGPPSAPDGIIGAAEAQKAFAMARLPSVNACPTNGGYRMDDPGW
jgi:hypothetical protein